MYFSQEGWTISKSEILVCGWYKTVMVYKQCAKVVNMTENCKLLYTSSYTKSGTLWPEKAV